MTQRTPGTPKMHQGATRDMLIWGVVILLFIGGAWWWLQNMEKSWVPEIRTMENYRKQPMLAAARLLKQRGYEVNEVDSLSVEAINRAANGTLIISNNDGTMSREQSQQLLKWVSQGNTLITFPQMRDALPKQAKPDESEEQENKKEDKNDDQAEAAEKRRIAPYLQPQARRYNSSMQDPISDYLGLASHFSNQTRSTGVPKPNPEAHPSSASSAHTSDDNEVAEDEADNDDEHDYDDEITALAQNQNLMTYVASNKSVIQLPHVNRPLQITRSSMGLYSFKTGPKTIYQDEEGSQVRLYQHGQGKIVAMPQNIFVGHNLKWNDNAQFLLDCASLSTKGKTFTIVKGLRLAPWYEMLWHNFYYCLLILAGFTLLWLWRGAQRFGLLLPEMSLERRALSEHIDASARWAWTTATGRQQLIDASRAACSEILNRRAPELLRLAAPEMLAIIATQTGLELTALTQAWQDAPSKTPLQFTRQIQLLQQLRAHYER